jgi:hypothetical protein
MESGIRDSRFEVKGCNFKFVFFFGSGLRD